MAFQRKKVAAALAYAVSVGTTATLLTQTPANAQDMKVTVTGSSIARVEAETALPVTVLTREGWDAACRELGREVGWGTRRANLWIEGIAVARRVGARLVIGEVVLEITGETTPCSRMDAQVPGLTSALTPDWRAGVTCRVVHGGTVRLGDVVGIASP